MSLSERLRDCEAAPLVIEEIKKASWVIQEIEKLKSNSRLKIRYPTKLGAQRALKRMIGDCPYCSRCTGW